MRPFQTSIATVSVILAACGGGPPAAEDTVDMVMTDAPAVPPPVNRSRPARLRVNLETREVTGQLADGVEYTFWTFGGRVPGKFMRVRVGDIVEFHLNNHPESSNPHNIDLHAVTGPGGGATSTLVAPGQSATFVFQAINPGLYVYHCATAPVGMHIANGMYGLILVEPAGGLPPVDREYYVMQGDFYTRDRFGVQGHQPFDMQRAINEDPTYVVFNGAANSLHGDSALRADVGETVRLYVGNGGPNLVASFHVIGEIFDRVWKEAGAEPSTNIQTTLVPAGGAAIVDFRVEVPGTFILVDHSIFRAFNKGALGMLRVEGPPDSIIYSGRIAEGVYVPEGGAVQSMPSAGSPRPRARNREEQIAAGKSTYERACAACHQVNGQGLAGAFPPLAGSDYLNANVNRAIETVVAGRTGPITVNGQNYNSVMPAQGLDDDVVANVLTYVYSQWGNNGTVVSPAQVARVRASSRPVSAAAH